jgi:hypothetical protein
METPGHKAQFSYFQALSQLKSFSKFFSGFKNHQTINKDSIFIDSQNRNLFSFTKDKNWSSCKKPHPYEYKQKEVKDSTAKKKLTFNDSATKTQKTETKIENYDTIHKLDLKKSLFKINNINFDINLNYSKYIFF